MPQPLRQARKYTAKEGAAKLAVSERYVRQLVAVPRDEWLDSKAREREAIRAYHDDEGHSWTQTAKHFNLHPDTVKRRAYRARKEHATQSQTGSEQATPGASTPLEARDAS